MDLEKTFAIYTLGCKVNQEESAALANVFREHGWSQVAFGERAAVCIINTCTVTQIAEKKSRNMLRRAVAANPAAYVAATGCYAQMKPEAAAAIAGVDLVLGANEKHRLFELTAAGAKARQDKALSNKAQVEVAAAREQREYQEIGNADSQTSRTRAFVKIEDGCNQFCSYCIVPYVRGPVRSRPMEAVLAECRRLIGAGYGEVVLTGIHVGAWGSDLSGFGGQSGFAQLVQEVVQLPGLKRLRLGSVEPREISRELIDLAAHGDIICPHFHVPMQAADDRILRSMKRNYDMNYYEGLVAMIRESLPEAAITTDIIAGFPGESPEIFAAELERVRRLELADAHIFPYSKRPGTPAADFPGQLSQAAKSERAAALAAEVAQSRRRFRERLLGREVYVLLEQPEEREGLSGMQGYTADYVPVFFPGLGVEDSGRFVRGRGVRLIADDLLWAEPIAFV